MRRREFLTLSGLALGSVLIPSQVARLIRDTCVKNGEPLIIAPPDPRAVLHALGEGNNFTLYLGDPFRKPEPPSWEEFLEDRGVDLSSKSRIKAYLRGQYGYERGEEPTVTLSEPIKGSAYQEWLDWEYELRESPMAQAYRYLSGLSICPGQQLEDEALGNLSFVEGDRPGSNLTYVEAPDLATLACLQHRLNELEQGVEIRIRSE